MKNIDPSEINIINYLSGEMSAEELKQFELQLGENPLLKTQVEEMKEVQDSLGIWRNEDIQVPIIETGWQDNILPPESKTLDNVKRGKIVKYSIPNWAKYAASFLGFVLLLQITGLKINQNGNALMLSFGEPDIESLNGGDVDAIVAKALETYAASQDNQLAEFKHQVNTDLGELNNAFQNFAVSNESNISQLKHSFNNNIDKQYAGLKSMIKETEDNQRQELEDSFTGYVQYVENKRDSDQLKIQNAFNEIATAMNNQQYQTNALLTSFSGEDPGLKSY